MGEKIDGENYTAAAQMRGCLIADSCFSGQPSHGDTGCARHRNNQTEEGSNFHHPTVRDEISGRTYISDSLDSRQI